MTRPLWPVIGAFLLLASCARRHRAPDDAGLPPQSELAEEVAAAGQSAWDDAKLHVAPETTCLLDELRIFLPDAEAPPWWLARPGETYAAFFDRACPRKWGCLGWRAVLMPDERGRLERRFVPIAYLSPRLPPGNIVHTANHENCHALLRCNGAGYFGDPDDGYHRNLLVWFDAAHTRVWSVEARSQRMLDGTPEPGSLPGGDEGLESP